MIGSIFLFNLLCGFVPCEWRNPMPEMASSPSLDSSNNNNLRGGIKSMLGFNRDKRLIPSLESGDSSEMYPLVGTENGVVKGYPMMVMSGRWISAFEGIPYAEAKIRFQEATPTRNWTGVRTAFQPGPYCLQIHAGKMFRVVGSEDCLTLNIYTPKIPAKTDQDQDSKKLLPCIIFIHGGSFAFGAGAEFGPSYMLQKDVVLVSINYRLGVLGFLSTGDDLAPGNLGLKDQLLALEWVQRNIRAFGGDPSKVTLMGQSAGSASVHYHTLSPLSKGRNLFHRAVMLSGTAHNHWALNSKERNARFTKNLAKLVKCPKSETSQGIMKCFREVNVNFLVGAQMNLFDWIPFPPVLFAPVLEPPGPRAFISESPEVIEAENIPAIFSFTKEEGLMANYVLNGMMKIGHFINAVEKYLPYYLDYDYLFKNNPPKIKNITDTVLEFYVGKNKWSRMVPMQKYAEMGTDRMFIQGINKATKQHAEKAPTYASMFSYLGKYNQGSLLGVPKNEYGTAHTEDLYYLFNASLYLQGFMQKDKEAELSKIMVNLIYNFAKDGEPTYTEKDGQNVRIWDPVTVTPTSEEIKLLQFDQEIKMIQDPFVERRKFWEGLGLPDTRPYVSSANRKIRISNNEQSTNELN